jgi:thioredoxin
VRAVSDSKILVVDCWAPWCAPCKTFAPVFEAVAENHPEHKFAKVNTEAESELKSKLGIQHIPTLLLYREGVLLFQQPGYYPQDELENIVKQAEAIDMEMVRKQIEEDERKKSENNAP